MSFQLIHSFIQHLPDTDDTSDCTEVILEVSKRVFPWHGVLL